MRNYLDSAALARDAAALYQVMTDLLRVYQFRDRDRVGYHGLTITQTYVMDSLVKRGPQTLNELAASMLLDKSTLSRVIDALETKKAVKRTPNPADGRSTLLEATASGRQRYSKIEADLIAENASVLAAFPAETRRHLIPLIAALAKAARERLIEAVD
jgi:DNA-binding MarR family transcriptional regulator